MEQQGALCALPSLGEHLRGDTEGEPGVHQLVGQRLGGSSSALKDRVEAHFPGVGEPLLELVEDPAVVEIRTCTT